MTGKAIRQVERLINETRRPFVGRPAASAVLGWVIAVALAAICGYFSYQTSIMLLSPLVFLTSIWKTRISLKSRVLIAAFSAGSGALVAQPIGEVLGPNSAFEQIWGSALLGAISAAPWLCIHGQRRRRLVSAGIVASVCLLPPYGTIALSSPYLAAGVLFPNSNVIGIAIIWLVIVVWPVVRTRAKMIFGVALFIASIALNVIYEAPTLPRDWEAVRSDFYDNPDDALASRYDRTQWLINAATTRLTQGAKLISFPETILGDMRPAQQPSLDLLSQRAQLFDATILIGLSKPSNASLENTLVFVGVDQGQYRARQPVPLIMWNLWSRKGYDAHWWDSGVYTLQGKRTALLICWEEGVPWPMLRSAFERPEVIISASNHGWSRDGAYRWSAQTVSANALSRLYGLPMLRAVNVPSVAQ